MSDKTKIEWSDASWNPVTGCDEVSPGCDHCYAKTFAERWRGTDGHYFEHGFDVQLRPDKLNQPMKWRKPRKIFVNSMSDLFHKDVDDDYIACVFAVMAATPHHTYQVLTKRHGRMRALLSDVMFRKNVIDWLRHWADEEDTKFEDDADAVESCNWPLRNVWLGVSVEDQKRADLRIPALLDTPAAVRFLSCEPLLGPLNLSRWFDTPPVCGCGVAPDGAPSAFGCDAACMKPGPSGIDWVIVGGESGHGARPMHPQWARSLRDQCADAGVPFLFKQWGEFVGHAMLGNPDGTGRSPWADQEPKHWVHADTGHVMSEAEAMAHGGPFHGMYRVGKHHAGRDLDGQTWDEFPVVAA